jgi:hypothetical protein
MQMNKITQTRESPVTLSEAKGLSRGADRGLAAQTLRFAQGDTAYGLAGLICQSALSASRCPILTHC